MRIPPTIVAVLGVSVIAAAIVLVTDVPVLFKVLVVIAVLASIGVAVAARRR